MPPPHLTSFSHWIRTELNDRPDEPRKWQNSTNWRRNWIPDLLVKLSLPFSTASPELPPPNPPRDPKPPELPPEQAI